MTIRPLYLFLIIGLISGCSSTPYAPAGNFAGFDYGGYSDTRVDANTIIVRFSGNSRTSSGQVTNDMLYRCAQVTLQNGYNYFVVTSTTTSPLNVEVKTQSSYNQYQTYPPKLHDSYYRSTQYSSYQYSHTDTPADTTQLHGGTAIIKMFSGHKPAGLPNSFDANDVIAHYGPGTF